MAQGRGNSYRPSVVNTRKGDPADFYLSHDFYRNPSFAGCPYLDQEAQQKVRTHSYTDTTWGLPVRSSPLFSRPTGKRNSTRSARCIGSPPIKDGRFSNLSWRCLSIRNTSQSDVRFHFRRGSTVVAFGYEKDATAVSDDCDATIANATRAITLVTCSSMNTGGRARTLLIFVQ